VPDVPQARLLRARKYTQEARRGSHRIVHDGNTSYTRWFREKPEKWALSARFPQHFHAEEYLWRKLKRQPL